MLCVVYHVNYHQAVSEEGYVLKVYCFFLAVSLASMQITTS